MTNTTLNNAVLSTLTNEKRVELAMLAGENYSQAGLFSADSKAEILECMAGCDYAMYQTVAQIWKKAYKADQNGEQTDPALMCSDNVADKAWSRMLKEFAIEVPKSATPAAVKLSAERQAEKDRIAAMSADTIKSARQDALNLAKSALETADLKKADEATKTVKTFDAELARRNAEANKPMLELMSKKREAIRKALNTATLEQLGKIETILALTPATSTGATLTGTATAPLVAPETPKGRKHREQTVTQ